MGLLSDLRQQQKQRAFRNRNSQTIGNALDQNLPKEDLTELIDLMNEPEIYEPLFIHAEALGKQSNLDDALRMKFKVQTTRLLKGDDHKERMADILGRFDASQPSVGSGKLTDRLHVMGQNEPKTRLDKMRDRIQETRQDIQDRVGFQTRKLHNRVRPLGDMAIESVRDLTQGVRDRFQSFKDTYRTKALAYENEQNWETALNKGVTGEQIQKVTNNLNLPEVRHGLIQHGAELFEQDAMTPQLASEVYYGIRPYLDANNPDHETFLASFNDYAQSVLPKEATQTTETANTQTATEVSDKKPDVFDTTVTRKALDSDREQAAEYVTRHTMEKYDFSHRSVTEQGVLVDQINTLQENTSLVGLNKHSEHVWEVKTDDGVQRMGTSDVENLVLDIYTEKLKEFDQAKANEGVEGINISSYGQTGNTQFKDSILMQNLMRKYEMDDLPRKIETGIDQPDIKQAELLGVEEGKVIWGVPFNGELTKIDDDDMEQAFVAQYGDTLQNKGSMADVIPLPEPPEEHAVVDNAYFNNLSDEFNKEYDDEARLMNHKGMEEQEAPPLPDEADMPPLSFEGIEEEPQRQRG